MTSYRIPALAPLPTEPRWQLPAPLVHEPRCLAQPDLPPPLLAVLQRRGFDTAEAIAELLDPPPAPEPGDHFADLAKAVARLRQACKAAEAVAICGDSDADGMTSTALLVGV